MSTCPRCSGPMYPGATECRSCFRSHGPEILWSKVDKAGPFPADRPDLGPCWLWTGYIMPNGYGSQTVLGRSVYAHRYAYELAVGPIPKGLEIDHLCRVRRCVNPAHLEPVTRQVNTLRGTSSAAYYALRTSCELGHPFNEANTRVDAENKRHCRTCVREYARQRRAAVAAGAAA